LKERSREVEDEVDTRPLLHHLKRSAENGSSKIGRRISQTALEAIMPSIDVSRGWDNLTFILCVGDDLGDFGLNELRVLGLTTETTKNLNGFVSLSLFDVITRRFGE